MTHEEIRKGLLQLGFNTGWVISGDEITVWENESLKPPMETILEAAKDYVEPELTVEDKLASVGLNLNDLKTALGL